MATAVHPGLWTWKSDDYAAGFYARLSNIAAPESAPHAWQCGWEDADVDLAESKRCAEGLAQSSGEDFGDLWWTLFDAGGDARVNGVAFDAARTKPWKEGWIDADIRMGAAGN